MRRIRTSLVVFDLFGTLADFDLRHHPFRQLLKWARQNGRPVGADDARRLMTINSDIFGLAAELDIAAPQAFLEELNLKIKEEVASLTLFDDVLPTLDRLHALQIPVAICSNLAQPYGSSIDRLLLNVQCLRCLSYEVGAIKPEQEIYHYITDRSGFKAARCVFVGDTLTADYIGPRQYGFNAFHLSREEAPGDHRIQSLLEIFDHISH